MKGREGEKEVDQKSEKPLESDFSADIQGYSVLAFRYPGTLVVR
jgi:hypothetical protein